MSESGLSRPARRSPAMRLALVAAPLALALGTFAVGSSVTLGSDTLAAPATASNSPLDSQSASLHPAGRLMPTEGTVAMDLHAPTAAAVPGVVRAASNPPGIRRTIKVNQCLSYTWKVKQGFSCTKLAPSMLPAYIDGTRVYLYYSGTWKLTAYRYSSTTRTASLDHRLLPRPALRTGLGSESAWTAVSGGQPYWDPCGTALTWKADFTALKLAAKARGYSDAAVSSLVSAEVTRLKSALATIGSAMGRTFTYAGQGVHRTNGDAAPDSLGDAGQPDILITYGTNGDIVGDRDRDGASDYETGFSEYTVGRGGSWYLMGQRTKADTLANLATDGFATFDYRYVLIASKNPFKATAVDAVRSLYIHELSHVMGLGHVADSLQLMVTTADPRVDDRLGAGDLRGLGLLGDKACFA